MSSICRLLRDNFCGKNSTNIHKVRHCVSIVTLDLIFNYGVSVVAGCPQGES